MRNSLEISHTTHIHTRCDHKLIEKKGRNRETNMCRNSSTNYATRKKENEEMSFGINRNFVFMVLS